MSESSQNKKDSSWPLKGLKLTDKQYICERLCQSISLKNILSLKPTQNYWSQRIVEDFPSPHMRRSSKQGNSLPIKRKSEKEYSDKVKKENLPRINFVRCQNNWDQRYIEMTVENHLKGILVEPIKDVQTLPLSFVKTLNLSNLQVLER
ncbi:UNVERIFIED_CONTAM: hypothetical protein RMT77_012688 [Armadillidium vulgare]